MNNNIEKIKVTDNYGLRLDKFISDYFDEMSRTHIKKLIDEGNVLVNGRVEKSKYKVTQNDEITINIPEAEVLDILPENIDLDIVYEDEDIIVINKEQGMVVHPAPGNYSKTLVNALLYHCEGNLSEINGVIRPGIVHRIDKDTTGLLVVAKNNNSHLKLAELVKYHNFTRRYIALVHGKMADSKGKIDMPIGRHNIDRKKMSVNTRNGREAVTYFSVIKNYNKYTLIECELETGRTHQIRVHLSHIGHPIVGDPVYSKKKDEFNLTGQLLHAKVLGFIHPAKNEYVEFEAPLPKHFSDVLNILNEREG
jgi:23S rRNA pseudouridine1911/1915/1917 synthase